MVTIKKMMPTICSEMAAAHRNASTTIISEDVIPLTFSEKTLVLSCEYRSITHITTMLVSTTVEY